MSLPPEVLNVRRAVGGPLLLNQKEAAALLGISTRTLARRSADGTIPSFLIGRRRLYSRDRLAQWVTERAA